MFFTKNISRDLWILSLVTLSLGIYYFYLGFALQDFGLWKWCVVGTIGASIIAFGQTNISANPLEVGLLTFWGKRLPVILNEGDKLLAPFFPFRIDVIRVPIQRQTVEFVFPVTARSADDPSLPSKGFFKMGGQLDVEVSIWYQQDYKAHNAGERIMQYLVSGGTQGINVRLEQAAASIARTIALTHTWTDFMALKAPLSAALLVKISDSKFRTLPRAADGSILESSFHIDGDAYAALPAENDPIEYVEKVQDDLEEYKRRYKEIEYFLQLALESGAGDAINLGIHLEKVNIEDIKPLGDLAGASDNSAVEDAERIAEDKDFNTEEILANKYLTRADARGEKMTYAEALQYVRINRKRASEAIVRTGSPLTDAAAVMSDALKGKGR